MTSQHTWKSIGIARQRGAYAGGSHTIPVWQMSKRELVEVALRLAALCCDNCETPKQAHDAGADVNRVLYERSVLKDQGII